MWFYVQHVLIGHQQSYAVQHGIPRGNLSDLYPRWLGARELLLHRRDPYSAEVTREIQAGYYGRPLDAGRPEDPKDQQGFAYPVYVVFLLAPTVTLPFPVVQEGFRWFLGLLTVATVWMWLRTLGWRIPLSTAAILMVATLGSFPVLQGIKLQQLTLLVSGLVAAAALLLTQGYFVAAGMLLALATIKPQLALPLSAWFLFWTFGDWRRRQNLVWGFAGTLAVLFSASESLLSGWIWRFRAAIAAYQQYNDGAGSVLDVLITPPAGKVLTALVVLVLAVTCWPHRRVLADSALFSWISVLVLAVTVMIAPKAAPYNQVLLLPGVLVVIRKWPMFWAKNRLTRSFLLISAVLFLWPWLAALVLTVGALWLPAAAVQSAWAWPVYTSLAIPVALVAILVAAREEFEESGQARPA
jgi:Glycosyltransferase family 87